ncbi:MAG TPA: hypothetical protein PLT09_04740 [Deltaproteobacteria bacterium]|nr:hypothetical protein [Deltaproteobacteria bacterium]HPR53923.1 hypothetical protein [Deltaproteobacteria bacterium]HXK46723.1 hypothetical protein [Deltaproteobacteria bacterium]
MHDLSNAVLANRILERIQPLLPERAYLVGGCIRDLLLGTEPLDFDLVTFSPTMELAVTLAGSLGGKPFLLDRERNVARVAVNRGEYTIDISPPRGADIKADLRERDITINAMACRPAEGILIDPLGGMADLKAKRIRLIGERNLLDDPLRGLRCIRFAVQLGYALDEHTRMLVRKHAEDLTGTAPERIKYEFLRALSGPGCASFFNLLAEEGYDRVLFGDVDGEQSKPCRMEVLRSAEQLLHDAGRVLPGIGGHFAQELEHGLKRDAAFRLAAFIQATVISLPEDQGLFHKLPTRLGLSTRARRTISGSLKGAFRLKGLAGQSRPARSDLYRVLVEHEGYIPEMLLLSLASAWTEKKNTADSIERVCRELWEFFIGQYRTQKACPLLTGHELMAALGITAGAKIGEMLREVEEARADGLISSPEEALRYLRNRVSP